MASAAVQSGNDDAARRHLAERKRVQGRGQSLWLRA
jgi:hypothetical protein